MAWSQYKRTGSEKWRNVLVEFYLSFADGVGERIHYRLPASVELGDIVGEARNGLMKAIDGFNIDRGVKFSTYAPRRIQGYVIDQLRKNDWVPRITRERHSFVNKLKKEFHRTHHRDPSHAELEELITAAGRDPKLVIADGTNMPMVGTIDQEAFGESEQAYGRSPTLSDRIASPDDKERKETQELFASIMSSLYGADKAIVFYYYQRDLSMCVIGKLLRLSESRVSQIHSNLLERLRAAAAAGTLDRVSLPSSKYSGRAYHHS